jgi:hypothetical protein
MFPTGIKFNHENHGCPGDELRELSADAQNLDIMSRYQAVFDAAIDAHMAGKIGTRQEAILPLLEIHGLVPLAGDMDRDFLTGENT